nr:MAG TPA: hypothetical protein [Caudoviricetes sp.]
MRNIRRFHPLPVARSNLDRTLVMNIHKEELLCLKIKVSDLLCN